MKIPMYSILRLEMQGHVYYFCKGSLSPGDLSPLRSANGKKDSEAREVSNCFTDRQSALASRKSGSNESVIIPECNPVSGLYQRTQCAQGALTFYVFFPTTNVKGYFLIRST